jgi:imidazolonepropionase-like amidohydrolase
VSSLGNVAIVVSGSVITPLRADAFRRMVCGLVIAALAEPALGQGQHIAIKDATIIDGTGSAPRAGMTILITDGRIAAVDSASRVAIPSSARIIDARDRFVIPGLWDMHVHLSKAGESSLPLFIANGVTSVRDMGGDFAVLQRWRAEIVDGTRVGPRFRTSGPILESAQRVQRMKANGTVEPVDRYRAPVASPSDAQRVVDSVARLGVDFIKVRTVASPQTYDAIALAARRAGLRLAAHGDAAPVEDMLRAGQHSVEHAIYPPLQKRSADERARFINELARARVAIVPTMINYYEWLLVPPAEARRIIDDSLGRLDPRRKYISGYLLEDWREQVAEREGFKDALIRRFYLPRAYGGVLRDLQEMHRAGVQILPGTDVGVALKYPGFSLRDELGYFVTKIGMTPMQAIVSATRSAAEFSGMADSLGTIGAGKLADLVVLDANPLADIRNLGRIHVVIARGRLYPPIALAQASRPR